MPPSKKVEADATKVAHAKPTASAIVGDRNTKKPANKSAKK
jgi:hypothetical protein